MLHKITAFIGSNRQTALIVDMLAYVYVVCSASSLKDNYGVYPKTGRVTHGQTTALVTVVDVLNSLFYGEVNP